MSITPIRRDTPAAGVTWESSAPLSPAKMKPKPVHTHDSVTTAPLSESDYKPLRPALPLRLIQMAEESYETMSGSVNTNVEKVRWGQAEMTRARESLLANAEKAAKKGEEVSWWSFMGDVVSGLLSAATLIGGAALTIAGIGTGNPVAIGAGAALVGSGAGGITALVLSKMGVDPTITGGIALASAGLALVGGITGWAQVTQEMPKLIMAIVQGGLGIAKGTSMWGQACGEADLAWLRMEKTFRELKESEARNLQQDAAAEMKDAADRSLEVFEASQRILKQQEDCKLQILRSQSV